MLNFLKRIRKKLLDEGNLKKYLFYAIGEILLVMIGILLALKINNWNQNRIDKRVEKKALTDLQNEFQKNKDIFDEHLKYMNKTIEEGEDFIEAIRDSNIPIQNKPLRRPSAGRRTYNPSMGMINSIMNSEKLDKLENDSLRLWLSNWNDIIGDFNDEVKEQQEFISKIIYPYEAALIPLTFEGKGSGFRDEKSISLYSNATQDFKYQNLLVKNYHLLFVQLEESKEVVNAFDQILRLINKELEEK